MQLHIDTPTTSNFNRALWTGTITSKSLKKRAFSLIFYTSDFHNYFLLNKHGHRTYDVLIMTNLAGK